MGGTPLKRLISSLAKQLLPKSALQIPQALVVGYHGLSCNASGIFPIAPRCWYLPVSHNSFDSTAFIGVLENQQLLAAQNMLPKFWFYVHDTVELGPRFVSMLLSNNFTKTRPLSGSKTERSANMGLYRMTDLIFAESAIMHQKSPNDPSFADLTKLKRRAIRTEDYIFNLLRHQRGSPLDPPFLDPPFQPGFYQSQASYVNRTPSYIYGTSYSPRIVLYFAELDLYKYKANFGGKCCSIDNVRPMPNSVSKEPV